MALLIQQYKLPQSLLFGKFGAVRMKLPINPVFREIFGGRLFPEGNDAANPIPLRADHQHAVGEPSLCFLD
jgi:hypothetical protein